jgi:glycosyltransferase involved in cell wall biosynthesis
MKLKSGKKVGVILSTYNGDRFITQLLDSLCAQDYPAISLYIRDDGSRDKTIDLIKNYDKSMDIHFEAGDHVGVVDSFFQLLSKVSRLPDIDYIAFCDQDDIWKTDKIQRAVTAIGNNESGPALYFSDYEIVNAEFEFINGSRSEPLGAGVTGCFENAIVQNIVPGFTAVINREAAVMISENLPCSDKIIMHDWWVYLVVSAFGKVVSDSTPTAFYRRHGNNTMDVKSSIPMFWKNRIKRYLVKKNHLSPLAVQAEEFRNRFMVMLDTDKRELLDDFIEACFGGIHKRIDYALKGRTYFQSRLDNLLFNLMILFEIR